MKFPEFSSPDLILTMYQYESGIFVTTYPENLS